MTHVHTCLEPYVDALFADGCEVHVPKMERLTAATFVYVTRVDQPGCALIQVPDFPSLGKSPEVSVPVMPNREHGSAVAVDFVGDPDALVQTIRHVLASATVTTRFVSNPRRVPINRRIPNTATVLPASRADHDLLVVP